MDYFAGQIVPVAFQFAPKQTALCQGQIMQITQNQALFALLGTAFGGDGKTTFGLPNTGGRTIVGFGTNGSAYAMGAVGGEANHTLLSNETPTHTHALNVQTNASGATGVAVSNLPSNAGANVYGSAAQLQPLNAAPLSSMGGGAPHNNMQPSLPINFAIVLYGIFPTRN